MTFVVIQYRTVVSMVQKWFNIRIWNFMCTYETFYGFLHRIPSSHMKKKRLLKKIVLEFCLKPLQNTCTNNHACSSSQANDVSQCSIVPKPRPYRAMYRSVLQSSALQCNVPQCIAVQCIAEQCTAVNCSAVSCSAMYRSALQFSVS